MNLRYAQVFAILLLAGCQPTVQDLSSSLDKGVGGYEGQVTPFTVPYTLRYEAGPEVTQTQVVTTTIIGGETMRSSMVWRVKISAIGEQRLWEFKIDEIGDDGKTIHARTGPILTARALSSSLGPIKEVDLNFQGFSQFGEKIPDRDSEEYQFLVFAFQNLAMALPRDLVSMNDELISGKEMVERYFAGFAHGVSFTTKSIQRDTLSAKIVGETYDNGVHSLVALLSGAYECEFETAKGTFPFFMGMRGYWLFDFRTGMLRRYTWAVEGTTEVSGETKRLRTIGTLQTR